MISLLFREIQDLPGSTKQRKLSSEVEILRGKAPVGVAVRGKSMATRCRNYKIFLPSRERKGA